LYSAELKGIRAADMARYFRGQGFRVFEFTAGWPDLEEHIAKGRPVIVALGEGGNALHYVVVAGIAPDGAQVNDPARRKLLRVDRADFDRRWHKHWALLAVPAESK
jgi:ABC-type bacteriocin/lantibiotic exporter with double-glycine peptidase domain